MYSGATLQHSLVPSCTRNYDEVSGLVTARIRWHVEPPNLGFLIPDTLGKLTVFVRNARFTIDGNGLEFIPLPLVGRPSIESVGSFEFSRSRFMESISLQSNGSGEMALSQLRPSSNPPALNFQVSMLFGNTILSHITLLTRVIYVCYVVLTNSAQLYHDKYTQPVIVITDDVYLLL